MTSIVYSTMQDNSITINQTIYLSYFDRRLERAQQAANALTKNTHADESIPHIQTIIWLFFKYLYNNHFYVHRKILPARWCVEWWETDLVTVYSWLIDLWFYTYKWIGSIMIIIFLVIVCCLTCYHESSIMSQLNAQRRLLWHVHASCIMYKMLSEQQSTRMLVCWLLLRYPRLHQVVNPF